MKQASLPSRLLNLIFSCFLFGLIFLLTPDQTRADRDTNSYDGNIFALYAGNGALVPPSISLEAAIKEKRSILLAFYLDDSSASKRFAPLLSDLQGRWARDVEIIALTSDPYEVNPNAPIYSPNHYWSGSIPQILVLDENAKVLYNGQGNMDEKEIETALALATGRSDTQSLRSSKSFNEYNTEYGS